MRAGWVRSVGVGLCGALMGTSVAQPPVQPSMQPSMQPWWRARLEHGTLTVWVVSRATQDDKIRLGLQRLNAAIQPNKVVVEKTMSEFGTLASAVGQTAGSYGQTSSSFGTSASDTGQTAGSAGRPANEVGSTASAIGQTASSYGQTAGSFGIAASSFGVNASDSNRPPSRENVADTDMRSSYLSMSLQHEFPGVSAHFVRVFDMELKDRLAAVRGTAAYPDVIYGPDAVPGWWRSRLGVTMLGESAFVAEDRRDRETQIYRPGTVDIVRAAPHPDVARAYWVWMTGVAECLAGATCGEVLSLKEDQEPVRVAQGALQSVLYGAPLGGAADTDAADFVARDAQAAALASYEGEAVAGLADQRVRTEVLSVFVSGRIAAVSLRGVVDGESAFGVVNALVMLHKADDGRWKVLQISPNQHAEHRKSVLDDLRIAMRGYAKEGGSIEAVSLAAPLDGDIRPERPELWWDNKGQARLQVVEWQTAVASGWGSSALQTVLDIDSRAQTRVAARFALQGSTYRWRVWSVGRGGALAMTQWRSFTVVGR